MALPLSTRRFLLLLEQMIADPRLPEVRSEHGALVYLKIDPTYAAQLRKRASPTVGLDAIDRATRKLGLRRDFFFDELSEEPDYRTYLETSIVRDDAFPELEAYRSDMERAGTPIAPEHLVKLKAWRRATGPAEREEIIGYHRGMIAADARKALERPIVHTPIDAERGQRQLPQPKRRRS